MRLINIHTLRMQSYVGKNIPPYACLSHRWTGEELCFEEYSDLTKRDTAGWKKIELFCAFLRFFNPIEAWRAPDYLSYVRIAHCWVDTVCIDKRSSAELTETINSMKSIYEDCEYCVAYLADVVGASQIGSIQSFKNSEWFRRCWTLQELLFPKQMIFCCQDWSVIGTKTDFNFVSHVAEASRIPEHCLKHRYNYLNQSVAQRMSWASNRKATRIEDEAYSLLGPFQINMPLLYGEDTKAFRRLQLEIIRQSDDESIFAWNSSDQWSPQWSNPRVSRSVLAQSPKDFQQCADVQRAALRACVPYQITNRGLEFRSRALGLELLHIGSEGNHEMLWIIPLNCARSISKKLGQITHNGPRLAKRGCLMAVMEMEDEGTFKRIVRSVEQEADLYEHIAIANGSADGEAVRVAEDKLFYLDLGYQVGVKDFTVDSNIGGSILTLDHALLKGANNPPRRPSM